jgi:hypothetical protein
MEELVKVTLHILLISVPEELFIILLALIITGNNQALDLFYWKRNLKIIMLYSVVPMAIISNVIKVIGINDNVSLLLGIFLTFITLIIIEIKTKNLNESLKIKKMISCLLLMVLTFTIFIAIEFVGYYLLIIIAGKVSDMFNQPVVFQFIALLPERIIELFIIYTIVFKKNNQRKFSFFKLFKNNKKSAFIIMFASFINLVVLCLIYEYFIVIDILKQLGSQVRIVILSISISLPLMFLVLLWIIVLDNFIKYEVQRRD